MPAAEPRRLSIHPSYLRVFLTFARNCLVRDMTFRANFIIECVSSLSWMLMNFGFYKLIFHYTNSIGLGTGWHEYEFFIFLSTAVFINSIVETFFMPNAEEFSEMVRTGGLDYALLKPIDTQFLVSLQKVDWSGLSNCAFAALLMGYSLLRIGYQPPWYSLLLYPFYVLCGVAILYSIMIALSATSVWLGRNQSLYDFWFYITNFARYPMEIYAPLPLLKSVFTFVIPVMIVVNVPARFMAKPLAEGEWPLAAYALLATAGSLLVSRWMFVRALASYRSASS